LIELFYNSIRYLFLIKFLFTPNPIKRQNKFILWRK
jgi:hypothetical protein